MEDIDIAIKHSKELFSSVPHFIYGHSMGGNLTLNYLIRRQPELKGGIIGSQWLNLTNDPGFIVKAIATFLKQIFPNITLDSKLDKNYMSTDTSEVEKYKKDPLNHSRISFRLFSEITRTGLWAVANTGKLKIPVLLMHGNADKITSHNASKLAAKNSKGMIEYVEWEGRYHELHNETNREEVARKVIEWITNHS
jgi:alpha-beta hydrolase superfamily lysophospholipase